MKPNLIVKPSRKHLKPKRQESRKAVTVCVAAIAERQFVITASDRMLTAGDVEFEPAQAKLWAFTASITALVAGDLSIQTQILREVDSEIRTRVNADPKDWVKVKDVASLYCKKYRELRREMAEAEILHPLGLDLQEFLARQSSMSPEQVKEIADKLGAYEITGIAQETIFYGIDQDGPITPKGEKQSYPQIITTHNDHMAIMSSVGFAAIGYGRAHAESQLQFYGHQPDKTFPETALLIYAAKKRAEAAPGVGKDTDMSVMGPRLGDSLRVGDKIISDLDLIYQKSKKTTNQGVKKAQDETKKLIDKLIKEEEELQKQKLQQETVEQEKPKNPSTKDQRSTPPERDK